MRYSWAMSDPAQALVCIFGTVAVSTISDSKENTSTRPGLLSWISVLVITLISIPA